MPKPISGAANPEALAKVFLVLRDAFGSRPSPYGDAVKRYLARDPAANRFARRLASKAGTALAPLNARYLNRLRDPTRLTSPRPVATQVPATPTAPSQAWELLYEALWCRNETTYDRGSVQDEPYVLVCVVTNGTDIVTTRHPFFSPTSAPENTHYNDVDDGNLRVGPRGLCWSGTPPRTMHISVSVMEHDESEPETVRQALHTGVTALVKGLEAAGQEWADRIPTDEVLSVIDEVLSWFGLRDDDRDDEIATQYVSYINTEQFNAAVSAPQLVENPGGVAVPHHFRTSHRGLGARYTSFFSWNRR